MKQHHLSRIRVHFTKFLIIVWTTSNIAWAADIPDHEQIGEAEHQNIFSGLAQLATTSNQHPPIPPKSGCQLALKSIGAIMQDSAAIVADLSAYSQRTLTALVTLGDLPKELKDKLLIGIAVTQTINTFCEQVSYGGLESSIQTQKALQTTYQVRKLAKAQQRQRAIIAIPPIQDSLSATDMASSVTPQVIGNIISPTSDELSRLDQDIQNLAMATGCEANYKAVKASLWQNSHFYLRFFELLLNLTHIVLVCSNMFDYSSHETTVALTYTLLANEIVQFFVNKLKSYGHTVDYETHKYRKDLPETDDGTAQPSSSSPDSPDDDGSMV